MQYRQRQSAVAAGRPTLLSALAIAVTVAAIMAGSAGAFYLPGVAPKAWGDGQSVPVKVDSLSSPETKLPYDHYDFKFCRPAELKHSAENLGEVFLGNRIENTPYDIQMNVDVNCKVLCKVDLERDDVNKFRDLISGGYSVNLIVDNLPGAMETPDTEEVEFSMGYWVGGTFRLTESDATEQFFLNNHVVLKIFYHVPDPATTSFSSLDENGLPLGPADSGADTGAKRIVRFEVQPFSINHHVKAESGGKFSPEDVQTCNENYEIQSIFRENYNQMLNEIPESNQNQGQQPTTEVVFSYGVEWVESTQKWATRWDIYLSMGQGNANDDLHWLTISYSILVSLFLTALVAMILLRTLRKDLMHYNRVLTEEEKAEEREESGWKLVHADVFRPPQFPTLFSVCVGTGLQLSGMTSVVVVFAALGFLSPANRGSLVSALMVLFVLMGIVGGYFSARMYKTLNGQGYQKTTLLTAFGFPTLCFAVFFLVNIFVWAEGSSAAVPFSSMLAVCALWFGISVPLCFFGAFVGYRRDPYEHPVRTSEIPRQIPEQPWYMHPVCTIAVAGILPFGAVFVELYFILNSIWFDRYYYVFGFLLLVVLILALTVAELTIVLNYLQLCGEDYRWWWQSFFAAGSVAFYVFLYSLYYFSINSLMTKFTSLLVFFSYTTLMSAAMFLITGSFGFSATYLFNRAIYGAIKVD